MAAILQALAPIRRILNIILPFAKPTTPLWRDILHSIILCTLLYYGPEIATRAKSCLEGRKRAARTDHHPARPAVDNFNPPPETEPREQPDNARATPSPNLPDRFQFVEDDDSDPDAPMPGDEELPALIEPRPHHQFPASEGHIAGPLFPNNIEAMFPPADHLEPRQNPIMQPPQPGPAQPRTQRGDRTVGKKKAASMERKENRRRYNEFMRSQGDAARAAIASEMEERAERDAEEKRKRDEYVRQAEEKLRKEREEKLRKEREEEEERREVVEGAERALKENGAVRLAELARKSKKSRDESWVEGVLRRGGVLGKGKGVVIMITKTGWLVKVDRSVMNKLWEATSNQAESKGKVDMTDMASLLGRVVVQHAQYKG